MGPTPRAEPEAAGARSPEHSTARDVRATELQSGRPRGPGFTGPTADRLAISCECIHSPLARFPEHPGPTLTHFGTQERPADEGETPPPWAHGPVSRTSNSWCRPSRGPAVTGSNLGPSQEPVFSHPGFPLGKTTRSVLWEAHCQDVEGTQDMRFFFSGNRWKWTRPPGTSGEGL